MGKKGKKAQAGKPKKLTPKDVGKRLNTLAKKVEEELNGADLFAPHPTNEDCAICLVPISRLKFASVYQACCGNSICTSCTIGHEDFIKKQKEENAGKKIAFTCPFCREPIPTGPTADAEGYVQVQARCLQNDHIALTHMGQLYQRGGPGTPKDDLKALDYLIRAVELGSAAACVTIGIIYEEGNGVAIDKARAALFQRVGALRGDVTARFNIGNFEYKSGNHEIVIRHWKIAAEAGNQKSLNNIRKFYYADGKFPGKELISKECMDGLYRVCHDAQMEVAGEEREKHRLLFELLGRKGS